MNHNQAVNSATSPAKRGGRPRRATPRRRVESGNVVKPVVSAQLEPDERREIDAIIARTGRSQSHVIRAAVKLLLMGDKRGEVDWSQSLDSVYWNPADLQPKVSDSHE